MTTGAKAHIFFTTILVVGAFINKVDFSTAFLMIFIFNMMMVDGLAENGDYDARTNTKD